MPDRPEPPPWGVVITAARKRAGLSAREAARRAGISEGRWRQIADGYQVVSPGIYAQVRGPAATVAKMAAVAGVTPAELRAAGREDAGGQLARQQQRSHGEEMLERVRALDTSQARELLATIAMQLGVRLAASDDDAERTYGT
jgi:hypothetical protein